MNLNILKVISTDVYNAQNIEKFAFTKLLKNCQSRVLLIKIYFIKVISAVNYKRFYFHFFNSLICVYK